VVLESEFEAHVQAEKMSGELLTLTVKRCKRESKALKEATRAHEASLRASEARAERQRAQIEEESTLAQVGWSVGRSVGEGLPAAASHPKSFN